MFQKLWIMYTLAAFTVATVFSPISGLLVFFFTAILYCLTEVCAALTVLNMKDLEDGVDSRIIEKGKFEEADDEERQGGEAI